MLQTRDIVELKSMAEQYDLVSVLETSWILLAMVITLIPMAALSLFSSDPSHQMSEIRSLGSELNKLSAATGISVTTIASRIQEVSNAAVCLHRRIKNMAFRILACSLPELVAAAQRVLESNINIVFRYA